MTNNRARHAVSPYGCQELVRQTKMPKRDPSQLHSPIRESRPLRIAGTGLQSRQKQHPLQVKEVDELVRFARMWAPYRTVPEEEVFVRFGISRSCFIERLREIVTNSDCDDEGLLTLLNRPKLEDPI